MLTKSKESLINQYDEVSNLCKTTGEPVYITENGENALVVMSVETYEKDKIVTQILEAEIARLNGEKRYSLKEAVELWKKEINKEC